MTKFLHLPAEIFALIMDQVSTEDLLACTLINRSFYSVANPILWRSPRIRTDTTAHLFLQSIMASSSSSPRKQVGRHIRHVFLHSRYWTDATLLQLLEHAEGLEVLDIYSASRVTDESLVHLPRHCPRLQSLYLIASRISQPTFVALGQHTKDLRRLNLLLCNHLSWRLFSTLVACPLEELALSIDKLVDIHDDDIQVTTKRIAYDLIRLDRLKDLRLHGVSRLFMKELSQLIAATTENSWPNLSKCSLAGYSGSGDDVGDDMDDDNSSSMDEHVIRFIESHRGLTCLHLPDIGITDTTLDAIGKLLSTSLLSLNVSYNDQVSAITLRRLVHQCPLLTNVSINYCKIDASAFPEAGSKCMFNARSGGLGGLGGREQQTSRLWSLDQDAINSIRNATCIKRRPCNNNNDDDNDDD
ncbi:hypothetical protein BCR42DRAFT_421396 [Absidia repens]|uniref:F-box domain-containing protein n=1 Tax=Absidia repens TaxID=90262 RepID=A0A1X2IA09_9FUNG|nr:hypothetical protein BCR42DRAFT_421396 [Absidia repens]